MNDFLGIADSWRWMGLCHFGFTGPFQSVKMFWAASNKQATKIIEEVEVSVG